MKKVKFFILVLSYFLISCDDESISRKELLTQSWILQETTLNGVDFNMDAIYLKNSIYTFFWDGTLRIIISQNYDAVNGTWQLEDGDITLRIAFSGVEHRYTIEKIDELNLWLSQTESDDVYVYKYKKMATEL